MSTHRNPSSSTLTMDDVPLSALESAVLRLMNDLFSFANEMQHQRLLPAPTYQRCTALLHSVGALQQQIRLHEASNNGILLSSQLIEGLKDMQGRLQELQTMADGSASKLPADAGKAIPFAYERLVLVVRNIPGLSESVGPQLHTLRPVNYFRNVFHIGNALLSVLTYEFVLGYVGCVIAILSVLLVYAAMDIARRLWPEAQAALFDRYLAAITRPRERYIIPAATWYCVSVFLVLVLCDKTIAQIAVLVLGVGDPAATLIGRRWGQRLKIYRQKSLAGFLGFIVVSMVVCVVFLSLCRPLWVTAQVLRYSAVAAVVGALAELLGDDRIDDNLTIPLAVAAVLTLIA